MVATHSAQGALRRADSSVAGATISVENSLIDAGSCVPRRFRFRRSSQPKNPITQRRGKLRFTSVQNASRRWIWSLRNSEQAGACYSLVQSFRSGATGLDRADVRRRSRTRPFGHRTQPSIQSGFKSLPTSSRVDPNHVQKLPFG